MRQDGSKECERREENGRKMVGEREKRRMSANTASERAWPWEIN